MTRAEAHAVAFKVILDPDVTRSVHEKIADALLERFEKELQDTFTVPPEKDWPLLVNQVALCYMNTDGEAESLIQDWHRSDTGSVLLDLRWFSPVEVHNGLFLSLEEARRLANSILEAKVTGDGGIVIALEKVL